MENGEKNNMNLHCWPDRECVDVSFIQYSIHLHCMRVELIFFPACSKVICVPGGQRKGMNNPWINELMNKQTNERHHISYKSVLKALMTKLSFFQGRNS
jgi:hypothetical protein